MLLATVSLQRLPNERSCLCLRFPAPCSEEAPTVSDAAAVAVAAVPSSPTVGPGRATDVGSELEEARLLVKGAPTVGPSKEVRLAKCVTRKRKCNPTRPNPVVQRM